MKTISRTIRDTFPGKDNDGLRKLIRETLRDDSVQTGKDMSDIIMRRIALSPQDTGKLVELANKIDNNDAGIWDL